jgi:hypothetical protein
LSDENDEIRFSSIIAIGRISSFENNNNYNNNNNNNNNNIKNNNNNISLSIEIQNDLVNRLIGLIETDSNRYVHGIDNYFANFYYNYLLSVAIVFTLLLLFIYITSYSDNQVFQKLLFYLVLKMIYF